MFLQLSKAELFLHFKNVEMFPTFWKCRNISSIIQMCFCSCQKLNCSYICKKCRNVSYIFEMQEISYIFPMCFCSCQKLNCSCILKMQKCFLHFGCRNISSISSKFLQLSKAELLLHFKNVEMFPTFWKCRNISHIFPMSFCSCQKLNCSYILKM